MASREEGGEALLKSLSVSVSSASVSESMSMVRLRSSESRLPGPSLAEEEEDEWCRQRYGLADGAELQSVAQGGDCSSILPRRWWRVGVEVCGMVAGRYEYRVADCGG